MKTLIRLTLRSGRNIFTAALVRAERRSEPRDGDRFAQLLAAGVPILFLWIGTADRSYAIPLCSPFGLRQFVFDAAFERKFPAVRFDCTRQSLGFTLHHGRTGRLFLIARVYNGKLFGYGDSRFSTAFERPTVEVER
jgi:hypothetical protein